MKKITLILAILLIGFSGFSQVVNVITTLQKNDTTYSFNIIGKNLDVQFGTLYSIIGGPVSENAGEIIWENIHIPGLGEHVSLKVEDGFLTMKKKYAQFKPFKEGDKEEQIKGMEENQQREINFVFYNKDSSNVINSIELKNVAIKYIEGIIQ